MVDFNALKPANEELDQDLAAAALRVLRSGWYILGPEVEAFEHAFAQYHGIPFAIGVANGTDALELALRAAGVGPGDEVITVAHTAVATVCAVERTGARPVLVDIDPVTYTMDPAAAEAAITPRTRALVPVHLYGHPANLGALTELARRHGLFLLEDCAQAHGATWAGEKVGTFGNAAAFSFYPTKNLGALGDGGAIITRDAALAERIRRLRNYGQKARYEHVERGINSRLDELQAALLRVKLQHLDEHNARRQAVAHAYTTGLRGVDVPVVAAGAGHVFHLYVVRHRQRDQLAALLKQNGVHTLIHYPIPVHRQQAYADLRLDVGSLPVTEKIASEILSLPLYVGIPTSAVGEVIDVVNRVQAELA
ncbi:MAG: DegT/DnrJ/EryC1/StrS family aminotransferase [Myxococcota bacterium]